MQCNAEQGEASRILELEILTALARGAGHFKHGNERKNAFSE
jgi:hypothetical protein